MLTPISAEIPANYIQTKLRAEADAERLCRECNPHLGWFRGAVRSLGSEALLAISVLLILCTIPLDRMVTSV